MTERNALIGQVKKLDGRPVVVVGTCGNDVQVDHWSEVPWTPLVHVDRLAEMPPHLWTDEDLSKLRIQAVEHLGVWNGVRALALGTLSLLHSFEHREKVTEDVKQGLRLEGKALDEVLRDLEQARADLATLNAAHEQALQERDEARELAHDIGRDRRTWAQKLADVIEDADIDGIAVAREPQCHVELGAAVVVAAGLIAKLGAMIHETTKNVERPGK
jgi:hypothetical protein